MDELEAGTLDLLYVSPERLRGVEFVRALRHVDVGLIACDEVHAALHYSKFRPAYGFIGEFLDTFAKLKRGRPPVVALTATATPSDYREIAATLNLKPDYALVVGDPVRENLDFCVLRGDSFKLIKARYYDWRSKGFPGRYVVYCNSRKLTEMVSGTLNGLEHRGEGVSRHYHAGMGDEERRNVERAFAENRYRIIVATSAFGLGINIPDIREVVTFGCAMSMEDGLQCWGRAGRDGLPSMGTLLWDEKGYNTAKNIITRDIPPDAKIEAVWDYLARVIEDEDEKLETNVHELHRNVLPECPTLSQYDVEPILLLLDSMGALTYRNAESSRSLVIDPQVLADTTGTLKPKAERVARAILNLPLKQDGSTWFDVGGISQASGLTQGFVKRVVSMLAQRGALSVRTEYNQMIIKLRRPGESSTEVIDYAERDRHLSKVTARLDAVREFAESDDPKAFIRSYFGYPPR